MSPEEQQKIEDNTKRKSSNFKVGIFIIVLITAILLLAIICGNNDDSSNDNNNNNNSSITDYSSLNNDSEEEEEEEEDDDDDDDSEEENVDTDYSSYDYTYYLTDEDDIAEAITIAKDIVKENLKVPSSADFPRSFDDYKISCSGNKYTVGFIFEAENSFGAKLKQIALVTYTRTGSYRYTYNPSDVYIGD